MDMDESEEELDPRIQDQLEILNNTTDNINRLEKDLDNANAAFRASLIDSPHYNLSKKIGSSIQKARPYYEALRIARDAHKECQEAAIKYHRANEIHQAAKETVALAEQRFISKKNEWEFDNTWQEVLNQATMKVIEAEAQKTQSEFEHRKKAEVFRQSEQLVHTLKIKLSREITKASPYFEQKDLFDQRQHVLKEKVIKLQKLVNDSKQTYSDTLKKLEMISEEIHERRNLLVREPGVGAEEDPVKTEDSDITHTLRNLVIEVNKSSAISVQSVGALDNLNALNNKSQELEECC